MKRVLVGLVALGLVAVAAVSHAQPLPQAASLVGRNELGRQHHALRVETRLPKPVSLVSQAKPFSLTHALRGAR
jgi:hypothetical protein